MYTPIKWYSNYRLPVPGPDAPDEEVLAYAAAYRLWEADRYEAHDFSHLAMAEAEPGHATAMLRASALEA